MTSRRTVSGTARADRQRHLLEPFAGLRAQGVGAGEPGTVRDQGQEARSGVVGAGVGRGTRDPGRARRWPRTARRRHRPMRPAGREDHPRHRLVVRLARPAEDVRRHDSALVLADVGELPQPGDVTDRPEPRAGRHPGVDGDAARVGRDADRLQPDVLDPGTPPGRDQQAVTAGLGAVGELEDVLSGRPAEPPTEPAPNRSSTPSARRASATPSPSARGSRGSSGGRHFDDGDRRAQPGERLRHLDADRAAAEHEQPGGTSVSPVTSRSVHSPGSSRRPGTGGMTGSDPVATTMCSAV